jgi:glucose-1-phosphate thymidylyltransferase
MQGIIMAGGSGSRLDPLTKAVNKHMLPIYNKPLIYYPLTTLILAGVKSVTVVTGCSYLTSLENLLGDGREFGIRINYVGQDKPGGIVQGIILSERYIKGNKFALILGDNLFHGVGLGRQLSQNRNVEGAHVFGYPVRNPSDYGVAELDELGNVKSLQEKPTEPKSNIAVTGLYFYDEGALDKSKSLTPSKRGELEITDLNNLYLAEKKLKMTVLPRGTAWLDTGTFEGLHNAASYVKLMEERQDTRIGNPKDAAIEQGWIS